VVPPASPQDLDYDNDHRSAGAELITITRFYPPSARTLTPEPQPAGLWHSVGLAALFILRYDCGSQRDQIRLNRRLTMSDELKKKKIMIKKKVPGAGGESKPVIKLNKPGAPVPPAAPAKTEKLESVPAAPVEAPKPTITLTQPAPAARPVAPVQATLEKAEEAAERKAAVKVVSETFKFYCVYCGQKLSAPRAAAGKQINCPACKATITIPAPLE